MSSLIVCGAGVIVDTPALSGVPRLMTRETLPVAARDVEPSIATYFGLWCWPGLGG